MFSHEESLKVRVCCSSQLFRLGSLWFSPDCVLSGQSTLLLVTNKTGWESLPAYSFSEPGIKHRILPMLLGECLWSESPVPLRGAFDLAKKLYIWERAGKGGVQLLRLNRQNFNWYIEASKWNSDSQLAFP